MERQAFEELWQRKGTEVGGDDYDDENDAAAYARQRNITEPALQSKSHSTVAKRIVDEARASLDSMKTGSKSMACSVCFTLTGKKVVSHESGQQCPQSLCGTHDKDWEAFKKRLTFRGGYVCFLCLLPTVSPEERCPTLTTR